MMNYAVFDSLLDSVLAFDAETRLVYANASASLLFGVSQKRLSSGKRLSELIQFSESDFLSPKQLQASLAAMPYREVSFESKSGEKGLVQVSVQRDGSLDAAESPHWIMYLRDVTLEQTLQRKYRAELEQKENVIRDLEEAHAALENYSKNLEKMVEERTAELKEANQLLRAILDSLGQGFLAFDKSGKVYPFFSRVCLSILESEPAGRAIAEVLKIPHHDRANFKSWYQALFDEPIPFADLAGLGPAVFPHSRDLRVELQYYPMRDEGQKIQAVVVVASDKTNEFKARQEAEHERAMVSMILKLIKYRLQFQRFLIDFEKLLARLDSELKQDKFDSDLVARCLHTIKGGAGSFSLVDIQRLAHEAEDILAKGKTEILRRVPAQLRDERDRFLKENELILNLLSLSESRSVEIPAENLLDWARQASSPLSERLLEAAREPIQNSFSQYEEMILELAQRQGKLINPLVVKGGELRIFPERFQDVFASIVHIFRNSVDHGIETPEERQKAGKPRAATIQISFEKISTDNQALSHIHRVPECLNIQIQDDGRGISVEKLREKLQEQGADVQSLTSEDILNSIFDSGISTCDEVSAISGRGVGLSAVKQSVEAQGGTISVSSSSGQGTSFFIQLPMADVLNSTQKIQKMAS